MEDLRHTNPSPVRVSRYHRVDLTPTASSSWTECRELEWLPVLLHVLLVLRSWSQDSKIGYSTRRLCRSLHRCALCHLTASVDLNLRTTNLINIRLLNIQWKCSNFLTINVEMKKICSWLRKHEKRYVHNQVDCNRAIRGTA